MLITTNGTTIVPTIAGRDYVISAAGTFGGGTLVLQWNDGTNDVGVSDPSGPISITAGAAYIVTAPTTVLKLVISGASSPSVTATVTTKYTAPYK